MPVPSHPMGNREVCSLSSFPTAAFYRKQPIPAAHPPYPPGERAPFRGLPVPAGLQHRAPQPSPCLPPGPCPQRVCPADTDPAHCAGQGCSAWGTSSLGERASLMGDRGPQCAQTGPTGVGSSCPAHHRPSVCSVQIRSCQDPLGLQRLVGQGSPVLPRAQQTGRPSPLPAARPWALSLCPGCTLQPPAGATPWLCGEGCAQCWALHRGRRTHTRAPPLSHGAVASSLPGSRQTAPGTGTPALPTRGKCGGAPLLGSKT